MSGRRAFRSKLTPELTDRLAELFETAAPISTCVASVGVARMTYYNWRERGLRLLDEFNEGRTLTADEHLYAAFAQRVCLMAFGKATLAKLRALEEADAKDWTRWAWILERSRPDQFALAQALRVDGRVDVPVSVSGGLEIDGHRVTSLADVVKLAAELGLEQPRSADAPRALPPGPPTAVDV
jgi:hypothetical protein